MWGLQKYQNHYEILFGRGCIDLENSAILLLLAQGKSDTLSFFEDCNMTKYLTNIFLLWINVNRLCSHVGLEFWTPNSFMCPKLTIFTTWKFRFTALKCIRIGERNFESEFHHLMVLIQKKIYLFCLSKRQCHWHWAKAYLILYFSFIING